ncbi:SAM-dependent methyltransferase [Kangiella sp. TOML190]|uniref:SAM-dependent methyltransferase n=1 Tax=Kangiella sp. TOML190 TaxID=2931351 RepID=UPI00203E190D|nr:SAM-dependent methyltransferase [Kangiella sp. TOML190]
MSSGGQLVCVGLGMTLGAHITPAAKYQVESADIVFVAASSKLVEQWVESLNTHVISLQKFYKAGKPRQETYREMTEALLEGVRAGMKVCGAFYGHPCVFALSPRKAIEIAKREGFKAYMEPGISAEACLYADLCLDPGETGCQHFETSQFMKYERKVDTSALLILWQIGLAGDFRSEAFSTNKKNIEMLVKILSRYYPLSHEVIIYEARLLKISSIREEKVKLLDLAEACFTMNSTLVIPPCKRLIDSNH